MRKIGVQLVAEGADAYRSALQSAATEEQLVAQYLPGIAEGFNLVGTQVQNQINVYNNVTQAEREEGAAEETLFGKMMSNVENAQKLRDIKKQLADSSVQSSQATRVEADQLTQYLDAQTKASQAMIENSGLTDAYVVRHGGVVKVLNDESESLVTNAKAQADHVKVQTEAQQSTAEETRAILDQSAAMKQDEEGMAIWNQIAAEGKETVDASTEALHRQLLAQKDATVSKDQFVASENLENEASQSLFAALMQESEAEDKLKVAKKNVAIAAEEEAEGMGLTTHQAHGVKLELMETTAAVASFAQSVGDSSQSLVPLKEGINSIAESLMVMAFIEGPVGLALAGFTAAAGLMGAAANAAADPDVKKLNESLDQLSKHDEAVQGLMKVSGATEEQAKQAMEAAKADPDYAKSLLDLSKAAEDAYSPLTEIEIAIEKITGAAKVALEPVQLLMGALSMFDPLLYNSIKQMQIGKAGLDQYTDAAERAQSAQSKLNEAVVEAPKTPQQIAADDRLQKQFDTAMEEGSRAAQNAANRIAEAHRQAANSAANAWTTFSDAVSNAQRGLSEELANIAHTRADDEAKAEQERIDKHRQANQQIADADYQESTRLGDIVFSDNLRKMEASDNLRKKEEETTQKIADAYRKLYEDTMQLGLDTSLKLQGARTENEIGKIKETELFDQARLQRRTDDEMVAATRDKSKAEADIRERQKFDDMRSEHEMQNADREHAHRVEQIRQQESEQIESVGRRLKEEEKALDYQEAQRRQREKDQETDAKRRYDQEVSRIGEQEKMEISRIKATEAEEELAHKKKLQQYAEELFAVLKIDDAQRAVVASMTQFYNQTTGSSALVSLTGRQGGGSVEPGRSYTVGEAGPEVLHMGASGGGIIVPMTQQVAGIGHNSPSSQILNLGGIQVDARGQSDPEGIATAVMAKVRAEFPGMLNDQLYQGEWR